MQQLQQVPCVIDYECTHTLSLRTQCQSFELELKISQKNEAALREQVGEYSHRFDEFNTTLTKSSEVFNTYKTEMIKSSQRIKQLEADRNSNKNRVSKANALVNKVQREVIAIKILAFEM